MEIAAVELDCVPCEKSLWLQSVLTCVMCLSVDSGRCGGDRPACVGAEAGHAAAGHTPQHCRGDGCVRGAVKCDGLLQECGDQAYDNSAPAQ